MSQPKMDELLGLGKRSWQKYEAEGVMPGARVVEALAREGWNANWILTGDGPRRLHELGSAQGPTVSSPADYAGPLEAISLRTAWLEGRGISPENLVTAVFPDDTMAPTIEKGDLVLADRARAELSANGLYMVEQMRQRTVVRLQLELDGQVTRLMDNAKFPSPPMPREKIEPYIIGTVFWIGGER